MSLKSTMYDEGGDVMERQGLLFALLATFLWGMAPVVEKLGLVRISSLAGITIRSVSIALILVVVAILTSVGKEIVRADAKTLILIIGSGIIAGLLGMWSYFEAMKRWEASRVVPIVGAYPLLAFIFSLIFLGEQLTMQKAIGVILVVGGIMLLG